MFLWIIFLLYQIVNKQDICGLRLRYSQIQLDLGIKRRTTQHPFIQITNCHHSHSLDQLLTFNVWKLKSWRRHTVDEQTNVSGNSGQFLPDPTEVWCRECIAVFWHCLEHGWFVGPQHVARGCWWQKRRGGPAPLIGEALERAFNCEGLRDSPSPFTPSSSKIVIPVSVKATCAGLFGTTCVCCEKWWNCLWSFWGLEKFAWGIFAYVSEIKHF